MHRNVLQNRARHAIWSIRYAIRTRENDSAAMHYTLGRNKSERDKILNYITLNVAAGLGEGKRTERRSVKRNER
jgi:hypothetical protein